jgi:hypothetical protein
MAMKQTTRTLVTALAFLGAAGAVGLGAVWVNKDEAKKAEVKEKSSKLFEVDRAKARGLLLLKAGALVAEVKRADANAPWTIAQPSQLASAEADEATVSGMIDKLDSIRQKGEASGMEAKAAGLDGDKPRWTVTLTEEGGRQSTLLIGEDNVFDATTYVKKGGEAAIRTVASSEKAPFEKSLFDLRDKRVAHLDATADVRRIEVTGTKEPYTLEKDGAGWTLAGGGKADAAAAEGVVNALRSLRATGVAAESAEGAKLRDLGLSPAKVAAKLTVGAPGGKDSYARTVLLGQPAKAKGSVAVKTTARRDGGPAVFEVDGQILKDLDKTAFELQDKTVLSFDREQVRRIDIAAPGAPALSIARRKDAPPDGGIAEETFELLAPQKGPAKKWKLSNLLYSLAGLRAASAGEPAPRDAKAKARLGLDKPRTVALFGEGDKLLARHFIGSQAGERRWVLTEGAARAVPVAKGSLDELPASASDALEPATASSGAGSLSDGGIAAPIPPTGR